MLAELQRLQASSTAVANSIQTSATNTLHNSTSQIQTQIPPHVQELYNEFSTKLGTTITDLRTIVATKDMPLQEKVGKMTHEVSVSVAPLLENLKASISDLLARGRAAAPETTARANGIVNGHAQ